MTWSAVLEGRNGKGREGTIALTLTLVHTGLQCTRYPSEPRQAFEMASLKSKPFNQISEALDHIYEPSSPCSP